jgi:hypothetical protein
VGAPPSGGVFVVANEGPTTRALLLRGFSEHWLLKYEALAADGFKGKALIHALLGDDWGPPPLFVRILENGEEVARIPY